MTIHELSERFFCGREHRWDLLGTNSLNQAEEAALNIFVVVSKELVDIFIEVLMDSDNHPLGIHLEEEQESQYGLSSEYYWLIF